MLNQMGGKGDEIKKRLENIEVEGEAAGGKVTAVMDGNRKVKAINFADDLNLDDKEELEDLLIIALNKASEKAENSFNSEMQSMARDFLPGMNL